MSIYFADSNKENQVYMSDSLSDKFYEKEELNKFEVVLYSKEKEIYRSSLIKFKKNKKNTIITFLIIPDFIENIINNSETSFHVVLKDKVLFESNSIIESVIKRNDNYYIAKCVIESIED